jgi:hypothetical protein
MLSAHGQHEALTASPTSNQYVSTSGDEAPANHREYVVGSLTCKIVNNRFFSGFEGLEMFSLAAKLLRSHTFVLSFHPFTHSFFPIISLLCRY